MIKLAKTAPKDLKEFEEKEWPIANFEHFGHKDKLSRIKYFYKAVDDNKIIGLLEAEYKEGVFYVKDLLVVHTRRHAGVGKLLIKKAEELAKKHKAHKIFPETGKGWIAEKFYISQGYKPEAILKNHWVKTDFIVFSKFLQ